MSVSSRAIRKKPKAKSFLNNEKPPPSIIRLQRLSRTFSTFNDVPPEVTVERIIDEVARTYGMTSEVITKQKSKKANVSNARHIAIYITRELTNASP